MRRIAIIITLCLIILPTILFAQTTTQNYVKTIFYKEVGNTNQAVEITYLDGLGRPIQQRAHAMSSSGKDIVTHIEYDAVGRQAREYLPFVSQSPTLGYSPSAATDVMSFYGSPNPAQTGNPNFEATGNPYSEKLFEASPLGRVMKQAAPGNAWKMPVTPYDSDHTIRTEYYSNSAIDNVRFYQASIGALINGYFSTTLTLQGTYPAGSLYKTVVKDENWATGNDHTVQEFKNKEGRIILKRTWGSSITNNVAVEDWHDTYYVYDDFGNLAFVVPPLSNGNINLADLNELCYQYRYDIRKRLVEKKLPGKDWEYLIYDNLNRVVATGPTLSPFNDITASGWLFTKYDVFGRVVYTGWMQATVSSSERNSLQTARNAQITNLNETKTTFDNNINGVTLRYTNQAWPNGSGLHTLTVNYYDNYVYPGAPTGFPDIEGQAVHYNLSLKPKGLLTGSWTRVLEASSAVTGETSYMLYDYKARPIRTWSSNYLGGYTQTDTKFDFSGKTLYTVTEHMRTNSDEVRRIREDFAYNSRDRLIWRTHKINNNPTELLALNTYDELGQLISKKIGGNDISGNTFFQKTDYSYNIRGWLKAINSVDNFLTDDNGTDLFAFNIRYDNIDGNYNPGLKVLYNGNISETRWISRSDNKERSYSYNYDALNRLRNATYFKERTYTKSYDESIGYDKNGNILELNRYGDLDFASFSIEIDNLDYTYKGNQLKSVKDNSIHPAGFKDVVDLQDEYEYDSKGNMVRDKNKDITISYNHLNLPIEIIFNSGKKINYLYNASGTKLKKTVWNGVTSTITDYLSGFQYVSGNLDFFPTDGGYVKYLPATRGTPAQFNYVFNFTDHLGNIRMSYGMNKQKGRLYILEENHYYPFGMKHEKYNSDQYEYVMEPNGDSYFVGISLIGSTDRKTYQYKYNGKEWQDELGLNLYDYEARSYDPSLGRWVNIDNHADSYFSTSPYSSFSNNPISFIDPTGEDVLFWQWVSDDDNPRGGKWEHVDFSKLDKKIQKGILDFLETKAGQQFFALFAKKGDRIGNFLFTKEGIYSKHNLSILEADDNFMEDSEGMTEYTGWKTGINFQILLNKDMKNPTYNIPETLGHEIFLHLNNGMQDYIKAFEKNGWRGSDAVHAKDKEINPKGYLDHLSVTNDRKGRALKYYEFISQLKQVLNPEQVQKHVDKERAKLFKHGTDVSNEIKNKKKS